MLSLKFWFQKIYLVFEEEKILLPSIFSLISLLESVGGKKHFTVNFTYEK